MSMTLFLRVWDGEIADTFPMFAFPFEPGEIHVSGRGKDARSSEQVSAGV